MDKTYIEKLTAIKESHNSKNFNTLKSELESYKSIIPEFFSRNGEAPGIRSMYEKINDFEYRDKNINAIDLFVAESVYDDYLNGMYTFVQDLNTAVITESDVNTYESKLNSAREKDSMFIESIFGGNLNGETQYNIREAAKDLEILINFIPKIDIFYSKSLVLSESMNSDNALVTNSVEMICESVSNYCYNVIKNVMNTYYKIMESFEESSNESPKQEYVLL